MPRRPRRERDGDLHHVVLRGHSGSPLFTCKKDAFELLDEIGERFREQGVTVCSWSGLTNHLHLIPDGPIDPVSTALRDATGPFARRMNKRTGGRGSYFQDRFFSKPIRDDDYATTAIVYVNRNPYTAGHVPSAGALEVHDLCAYGELLGIAPPGPLPLSEYALRFFAADENEAQRVLREQMYGAIQQWERDKNDPTLEGIIRTVAGERGVPPDVIRSKSRHGWITDARIEIVRRALTLGVSQVEIARGLGVSPQAVNHVVRKLLAAGPVVRREEGWARLIA